jgi:hypothetical protein
MRLDSPALDGEFSWDPRTYNCYSIAVNFSHRFASPGLGARDHPALSPHEYIERFNISNDMLRSEGRGPISLDAVFTTR